MKIISQVKNQNSLSQYFSLSIFILYFFSIIFLPFMNTKVILYTPDNIKNNAALLFSYNTIKNNIDLATYINNGQMLDRQINNNNLQSYINDAKGSVLKLSDFKDAENNKSYSYDAYGNIISSALQSGSVSFPRRWESIFLTTISNSFQYNGERFDNNSQLQYLRARFYNLETKRFITQDAYQLLNKFGYVNANPIMYVDPTGHDSVGDWFKNNWKWIAIGVGVLVIGGGIFYKCRNFSSGSNENTPDEVIIHSDNSPHSSSSSNTAIRNDLTNPDAEQTQLPNPLSSPQQRRIVSASVVPVAPYSFQENDSINSSLLYNVQHSTEDLMRSNAALRSQIGATPITEPEFITAELQLLTEEVTVVRSRTNSTASIASESSTPTEQILANVQQLTTTVEPFQLVPDQTSSVQNQSVSVQRRNWFVDAWRSGLQSGHASVNVEDSYKRGFRLIVGRDPTTQEYNQRYPA